MTMAPPGGSIMFVDKKHDPITLRMKCKHCPRMWFQLLKSNSGTPNYTLQMQD